MHHAYRKAKHFKLEFDDEEGYYVADEFSGGSKKPVKGWKRWSRWTLSKVPRPERYLESKIGQRWDSVWSDICRIAKQYEPYRQERLRERFHDAVETNVQMIDGKPHGYSRWYGLREIWHGDFYVDPDTNLICQVPSRIREKKVAPKKDNGFAQINVEYERKVSPGVFKTVVDKVWIKTTTVEKTAYRSNWKRNALNKEWEQEFIPYIYTISKTKTASKKDIRDNNLNETE